MLQPRSDSITFQILLASTAICKVRLAMPSQQLCYLPCRLSVATVMRLPLFPACTSDDIGTFEGMGVPKRMFFKYLRRFFPFFHVGCLCVRA